MISGNVGVIYKLKGIVPEPVLKTLYHSFIQSNLNYCSSVWGLKSKNSVEKLFRVQKKAIRAIENRYNNYFYNKETGECPCHTKEIFARNNLLTVHNLIAKNCMSMMQKVHINLAPHPILNLFCKTKLIHNARRRKQTFFDIPYCRLKSGDNSISYKGPKIYNNFINQANSKIIDENENNYSRTREPLMQNKFYATFKKHTAYLIKTHGDSTWRLSNFPLFHDNI